jgi:hypothetical protein
MEIPYGAQVHTGADGMAEITCWYGIIRVKPNSVMHIPLIERPKEEKVGLIEMIAGKIWLKITKGDNLEVKTSSAIAGIRGTEFSVEVNQDGRERFSCLSGEIVVKPTAQPVAPGRSPRSYPVSAGHTLGIATRGQATGVRPLTPLERLELILDGRSGIFDDPSSGDALEGMPVFHESNGPWTLQIMEHSGFKHGILTFEGLRVGDLNLGEQSLASPFGALVYRGQATPDSKSDSGWLFADE